MAISKSTPYVRYKKDFTSSLHLGTIHIESEYLDRTQKTTIESIHGMTWHNKVVNENKELNLLSDTQLELTELEKQYWNTGEKRVSVDEIHTLEEVEPNEDGTYTYTVNSMEGEYIEIYDGINNITSTSDGLDGQFEIVYDTTEEDMNGNIALDSIAPQYEITDSGVGAITNAKSTGLTLVNHITEPSKEEVVAIEQQEGQYFTIDNTVQGNIKSAILKGMTLVNVNNPTTLNIDNRKVENGWQIFTTWVKSYNTWEVKDIALFKPNTKYYIIVEVVENTLTTAWNGMIGTTHCVTNTTVNNLKFEPLETGIKYGTFTTKSDFTGVTCGLRSATGVNEVMGKTLKYRVMIIEYREGMENWDIPYFEGMQSVKMPVLKTVGKNLFDKTKITKNYAFNENNVEKKKDWFVSSYIPVQPNTDYKLIKTSRVHIYDENKTLIEYPKPTNGILTTPTNASFIRINGQLEELDIWQVEEGSITTSYEPYKSNILTVNEDVELRGIGDVKDELNLMTGELTQRIGEVVLNGSENWVQRGDILANTIPFAISFKEASSKSTIICDKFKNNGSWDLDEEHIWLDNTTLQLHISKTKATNVSEFKTWLANNNVHLNFKVSQESIKTVDLTVQNQDGNIIPHIQTQQGITHISTSSDGLTPTVEMSCSYDTIIKPNTTYTIKLDRPIVSDTMNLQVDLGGTMMMLDADVNAFTIKTPSTLLHSQLRLSGVGNTVKEIIVLEGNRVNDKIEYFEGMKNVENPILVVSSCPYVFGKGGRL